MELVQGSLEDTLTGLQIGGSSECLGRVLDAQRTLFHSQIDQLQKIVVTQCKLTGSNPLSQEMAAGALSIKIGKRPRDLLNPKAIKYMQSIFSIKDTISKKETREISALCGVTITQVREFFASQRSRVRKLVRLSREKAVKSNAGNAISNGYSSSADHVTPISNQTCENHENDVDLRNVEECTQVPINSVQPVNAIQQANEASRESANINSVAGSFSCSPQEETIPGIDSDDQEFVENIFSLMRKEEAFSGQVKLMEWILQIRNSAVLQWFLAKGGVMILATWLGQAAFEEQTTVLLVIFKVLCHLPLHKALPAQMSAILQSVNKLRFYRTSDISNKARVLLSRWSKMFIRSQALKRPFSMNYPSDNHKEIIRKQRISEILSDESWLSKVDLPEDVLALAYEGSEDGRKSDRKSTLKLLPATCNDSSKKQSRSVSCPKTKERRKVLLVEQPDHKPAGRSVQVTRALPAKSSRPMSADDIQKAKMRAIFMQRKYGNTDTPANENHFQKAVNQKISIAAQANGRLFMPKLPKLERDEDKKFEVSAMKPSEAMHKMLVDSKPSLASGETRLSLASLDSKPCLTSQESLSEKLKNDHITWQMPAAVRISGLWSVGTGENSKEMEVQTARIRREKETFYVSADEIPANPKDPWDIEMDYDDSLTPEIPTEPPPDADGMDVVDGEPSMSPGVDKGSNVEDKQPATALAPGVAGAPPPEPDLELLAVLLKNPELVFALTLGQGNNLTNTETVALLDVLKKSNGGLPGMLLNGSVGTTSKASESPTSLPSPTPPSERARMGWRSEHAPTVKDLWLQHQLPAGVSVATGPPAPVTANASPSPDSVPGAILVRSTVPLPAISGILSTARLPEIPHPPPSRLPGTQLQPISSPSLPHNAPPPMPFPQRVPKPEVVPPSKHLPVNASAPSLLQHQETVHLERMISRKLPSSPAAAAVSTVPPLLPTPPRVQPPLIPEPPVHSSLLPRWPSGAARGSREPVLGSWHGQPNGLLESPPPASAHNPHFSNDQRNVSIFAAAPIRMHSVLPTGQMAESNDLLDRSELEPWSPERSPLRGPEYPPMRGYPEQRRGGEYGRGDRRPERSRQNYVSGHRDRHRSGRRWRDRDRRP